MKGIARALMLGALMATTAAGAQSPSSTQHMRFTGSENTFSVVATATANVSADEAFLRVALDHRKQLSVVYKR